MSVEIVAEIGINHDGNLAKALCLIDAAVDAGATIAKFQASFPRLETSARHAPEHLAMIERYILPHAELMECHRYCETKGIEFLCTPAEEASLAWMMSNKLVKRIKVSSDNLTNRPFLRAVGATGLPIILSTGMASMDMIYDAWEWLMHYDLGKRATEIIILHCTSSYPCRPEDANLAAIPALRRAFPRAAGIGWSDHTTSLMLPAVAVGLGACMIEKHFTMGGEGPDHDASLGPFDFGTMILNIQNAERAMGESMRMGVLNCELETERVARKSIVAARAITKGQRISADDLAIKRPGTGLTPSAIGLVLAQPARRDYAADEQLDYAEIE